MFKKGQELNKKQFVYDIGYVMVLTCEGVIKSSRSVNCNAPLKREAIVYICILLIAMKGFLTR